MRPLGLPFPRTGPNCSTTTITPSSGGGQLQDLHGRLHAGRCRAHDPVQPIESPHIVGDEPGCSSPGQAA